MNQEAHRNEYSGPERRSSDLADQITERILAALETRVPVPVVLTEAELLWVRSQVERDHARNELKRARAAFWRDARAEIYKGLPRVLGAMFIAGIFWVISQIEAHTK